MILTRALIGLGLCATSLIAARAGAHPALAVTIMLIGTGMFSWGHHSRRPRLTCFRTSTPDHWTSPRAYRDPALRHHLHGPIVPMGGASRRTARERLVVAAVAALVAGGVTLLLVVAG